VRGERVEDLDVIDLDLLIMGIFGENLVITDLDLFNFSSSMMGNSGKVGNSSLSIDVWFPNAANCS